jgi:hypothetical protein
MARPVMDGIGRLGGLVHPAGFDVRSPLQSLQPRDLLTQLGIRPFQFAQLREQAGDQLSQLGRRQSIKVCWPGHTQLESELLASHQRKNAALPGVLPVLP